MEPLLQLLCSSRNHYRFALRSPSPWANLEPILPNPHLLIIVKNTPHIVAIILRNFTASINRKLLPLTIMGLCQHQIMLTLLECVCKCTMPALEAVDIRGCKLIRCGPRALWVLVSGKIFFFFLYSSLILSQGRSCLGCHVWQTRKPV